MNHNSGEIMRESLKKTLEKIRRIINALGYDDEDKILVTLRREGQISEENLFEDLHKKYGLNFKKIKIIPTTYGEIKLKDFIKFLEEYDELWGLETVLIDLSSVIINPAYL